MFNFMIRLITNFLLRIHDSGVICTNLIISADVIFGLVFVYASSIVTESTCSLYLLILGIGLMIVAVLSFLAKIWIVPIWNWWTSKFHQYSAYRVSVMSHIDSSGNIWIDDKK